MATLTEANTKEDEGATKDSSDNTLSDYQGTEDFTITGIPDTEGESNHPPRGKKRKHGKLSWLIIYRASILDINTVLGRHRGLE